LTALTFIVAGAGSRSSCRAFHSSYYPLFLKLSSVATNFHHSDSIRNINRKHIAAFFATSSDLDIMKKHVLIPISDGSEEIETACIQDTLVRFGADVVIASCKPNGELTCKLSRGLKVLADMTIEEAAQRRGGWDLVALPGGMPGAEHLRDCETLISLLKQQQTEKRLYAAICATPAVALAPHGLLPSSGGATCYPLDAFRSAIKHPSDEEVVVQDNVVTSQGPGTSLQFALTLGERLYGKEMADKVAKGLLVSRS